MAEWRAWRGQICLLCAALLLLSSFFLWLVDGPYLVAYLCLSVLGVAVALAQFRGASAARGMTLAWSVLLIGTAHRSPNIGLWLWPLSGLALLADVFLSGARYREVGVSGLLRQPPLVV